MSQGVDKKAKRKWLLIFIFAPGIFFILFWAAGRYYVPEMETVEPPDTYVELGERVERDGVWYLVYRGETLFTDRIDLGKNLAIAEPGRVFVGLGLGTDAEVFAGEVEVIDSMGGAYKPLDVKSELVARNFGFEDNADYLFMFKVNSNVEYYFFKLGNGEYQAWRFANNLN